jgi:GTPase
MDKDRVLRLLDNIEHERYVSIAEFNVVHYAVDAGLLTHAKQGGFTLAEKGKQFLKQMFLLDELIKA